MLRTGSAAYLRSGGSTCKDQPFREASLGTECLTNLIGELRVREVQVEDGSCCHSSRDPHPGGRWGNAVDLRHASASG